MTVSVFLPVDMLIFQVLNVTVHAVTLASCLTVPRVVSVICLQVCIHVLSLKATVVAVTVAGPILDCT